MLHGILNEQGHCLDVRDDISGKYEYYFRMFSFMSLATGALILGINSWAIVKP